VFIDWRSLTGIDSLLTSEWQRLEDIQKLLQPFATQTDVLQTDSLSLSNILPSILDLECHLQLFPNNKQLTANMLKDLRRRFEFVLEHTSTQFNPIPFAACLLDPQLASILLAPELQPLLNAAKSFIVELGGAQFSGSAVAVSSDTSQANALGRFRFLAAKLQTQSAVMRGSAAEDAEDSSWSVK